MSERGIGPGTTDEELEELLRSYAHASLGPEPEASARMRAVVMAAARSPSPAAEPSARTRLLGLSLRRWRPARLSLALSGAALVVAVSVGAVAAAGPGSPLYGVRLWVDAMTLPSDAGARVDADLARMQARLDEASAAAARGDGSAVSAALEAYRVSVADALRAAGTDLSREQRLQIVLQQHRVVLQALVGTLPADAANAIERTLTSTDESLHRLAADEHATPNPGESNKPSSNPGQGNGPSANPGQSNKPSSNPGQGNGPSANPGQGNGPSANPGQGNVTSPSPAPSKSPPAPPSPKPSHSAAPH